MQIKGDVHELVNALSGATGLEQLSLRDCGLNNDDARVIAQIKSIRQLDISANGGITDTAVQCLGKMPNLENLSLGGCNMSPACIKYLKERPRLKQYALHFDQWKPSEMDKLRAELKP